MPYLPPHPCKHTGCKALVSKGSYCDEHKHLHKRKWNWDANNSNRHARGYGSTWNKLRKLVFKRDFKLCQVCLKHNKYTEATEVDHIISKAQGGTDDLDNLQSICKPCHQHKTATERTGS